MLQELTDADLSLIQYYGFTYGNVNGTRGLISRTGYTGEDGFEIYIPVEEAPSIWERLFQVGKPFEIRAAGLAARNTLRLEVSYCLYGHEIDETTTPWEAGLGWIVRLGKGKFIGHDTLEKLKEEGKQRKLAGFEMVERGIARDHYPVIVDGTEVGQVTSGSFAPSLKKSVVWFISPSTMPRLVSRWRWRFVASESRPRSSKRPFILGERVKRASRAFQVPRSRFQVVLIQHRG